jgi:ribonuclease HII
MEPDPWAFERRARKKGFRRIAGLDEAGRGPLAGPVVSAAVILPRRFPVEGVGDSKKLAPAKRLYLYEKIYEYAAGIGIGIVDAVEIDRINILKASLLSMSISIQNLDPRPDFLLVDGICPVASDIPQETITGGDALAISIGAASIVAKVTRDRLMERYDLEFPEFGFCRHKGYPTEAHREAIRKYGCCPIHRKSFKTVFEYFEPLFHP